MGPTDRYIEIGQRLIYLSIFGFNWVNCRAKNVVEFIASDTNATEPTEELTSESSSMNPDDLGSSTTESDCSASNSPISCDEDNDIFHALGLSCSGSSSQVVEVFDASHMSPDFAAWRILALFGNSVWVPREGSAALLLSTGRLGTPSSQSRFLMQNTGWADGPNGGNENPDHVKLPEPIRIEPGSNRGQGGTPFLDCDGVGDCSDSLQAVWDSTGQANDLQWLRFRTTVPQGVFGFQIDLAWFSAEFPRRVVDPAQDVFVLWSSSQAFTGNLATMDGQAMTAQNLRDTILDDGHLDGQTVGLELTGFDGTTGEACEIPGWNFDDCPRGASTSWMTLSGPVVPGEELTIVMAVFDQGDDLFNTAVLLDHWRWDCEGCFAREDCGLQVAETNSGQSLLRPFDSRLRKSDKNFQTSSRF